MGFTRFHLPWVLAYKANRQYLQACRLLRSFL